MQLAVNSSVCGGGSGVCEEGSMGSGGGLVGERDANLGLKCILQMVFHINQI